MEKKPVEVKKLTEALKEAGLPERQQLILALAPGIMFGFAPPNLDKLIERVDCPTCRKIMENVSCAVTILYKLEERIHNLCGPVREKNKARQEEYERRRRVFILGLFARPPRLEKEPEYKSWPWYAETMQQVNELEAELASLSGQDVPHWGDEENKQISREVVGLFLQKDSSYMLSL